MAMGAGGECEKENKYFQQTSAACFTFAANVLMQLHALFFFPVSRSSKTLEREIHFDARLSTNQIPKL